MERDRVIIQCLDTFDGLNVHPADIREYEGRAVVAAPTKNATILLRQQMPTRFLDRLRRHNLHAARYIHVPGSGSMIRNVLANEDILSQLRSLGPVVYENFITTKDDFDLVAAVPNMELAGSDVGLVQKVNDKTYIRKVFGELNLPLLPGRCCKNLKEIQAESTRLRNLGYQVVVKEPDSAAGNGFHIIGSYLDECRILEAFKTERKNTRVVVEQWVESKSITSSPSGIAYIEATGNIRILSTTSQMLEQGGRTHLGNVIPVHESDEILLEIIRQLNIVGRWLKKKRWRGPFGVDFIVVWQGGKKVLIPTEVNGRYTGSMYLANVYDRIGHEGVGYMSNLSVPIGTTYEQFEEAIDTVPLREGEILLPHNIWCFARGKAAIIILAETKQRAEFLFAEVKQAMKSHAKIYYDLAV